MPSAWLDTKLPCATTQPKLSEIAKAQTFDLIFSDVVMPGKDGLSLLEELKSQGVSTPVVMMSGQAHIEMAVRATRLGALDFLEKPLSTDKLLLTVENAMKLQRLRIGKSTTLRSDWASTTMVWTGETMKQGDGAGGARGRQRDARVHSGRDGNGQGTGGAHAA